MVEFKPLSYEAVSVGEQFKSDDFLVKPEDIDTYAYAVDDHDPWYFEDSPLGGKIAPPTLLANQALAMRHSHYLVNAGLHAKMQFEFLEPLRAGMRVRSYGRVIDKYERRDRHYMVTAFETRDEETGKVLVRGQFTQMIFPESGVHRETKNR
jgi:acyl dehydratase